MTTPTGTISLSDVNTELGFSATALISMNDAAVRTLAGVPSGAISMDNLRGKTNAFQFTISTNQTDANLRTLAVAAGWDQTKPVEATIASGVVISGTVQANSTAALTIDGSWPSGVTLINSGSIVGRGGNAGAGGSTTGFAGTAGGRALLASSAVSINNLGTIAGGGGGGGGGGACSSLRSTTNNDAAAYAGGGGGGGGRSSNTASIGGTGGSSIGSAGSNGANGSLSAAGAGGAGGSQQTVVSVLVARATGGTGGTGGDYGTAGSNGANGSDAGSSGGTGGGTNYAGGAGGAAGQAVSGNSNITWIATGTRLGPIV